MVEVEVTIVARQMGSLTERIENIASETAATVAEAVDKAAFRAIARTKAQASAEQEQDQSHDCDGCCDQSDDHAVAEEQRAQRRHRMLTEIDRLATEIAGTEDKREIRVLRTEILRVAAEL